MSLDCWATSADARNQVRVMPIRHSDDSRGLDPEEFPDPDESDPDDDLSPCPYCKAMILEESERCPACGNYISYEDSPLRRPWWFILGVLVCLAITFYWIWRG